MRIVQVSCSANAGGAAIAANRLHLALLARGADSYFSVARRAPGLRQGIGPAGVAGDFLAKLAGKADRTLCRPLNWHPEVHQSAGLLGSGTGRRTLALKPDVINLHWINNACLSLRQVRGLRRPLVWTLHDMWPFIGVSHFVDDLEESWYSRESMERNAASIPAADRMVLRYKRAVLGATPLTVVTPSRWLADCARRSHVLWDKDVRVLPNCIEDALWYPVAPAEARAALDLPTDARILLFSAGQGFLEPRKGGDLFVDFVRRLAALDGAGQGPLVVLLLGERSVPESLKGICDCRALGYQGAPEKLRLYYASADFSVIPSRVDNLPNVALEAQACGTPVLGFAIGGMPDIVESGVNGYLAPPFDTALLAGHCADALRQPELMRGLRRRSSELAQSRYAPEVCARAHLSLYEEVVANYPGRRAA